MQYLVFDIETTGLDVFRGDIIQMAYLKLNENMQMTDSGCMYYYKEGMRWSAEAEAVHKIPQDYLRQYAAEFDGNVRRMFVLLNRANIVGHNVRKFDYPFCRSFLERNGMRITKDYDVLFAPNQVHDTLEIYKSVVKGKKNLGSVLAETGISESNVTAMSKAWFKGGDGAHDARWDATAAALLFVRAVRRNYV
jgi:DNA polymerase III epsilon subunit-like protein